jgi:DNA-binding NarL/FixJ family response regulator
MFSFPGGMETVKAIRRRRPDIRLIVIGPDQNEKLIVELIRAGVRAYLYLRASPRVVRQAFEVVASGSIWAPRGLLSKVIDEIIEGSDASLSNYPPHLTERELQILDQLLLARSNREISLQLGIAERTVQAHIGRLMRKVGANCRIDVIMRFIRSSNPVLMQAAQIKDRRQADRRQM